MVVALYFLGASLLIASVFLILDTQQSRRVNRILRDTKSVQPLFSLRSAEHKLNNLNKLLYSYLPVGSDHSSNSKLTPMNEDARQLLSAQLNAIIYEYKSGEISLQTYNDKLNELVKMTNQVRMMRFERVK
jgi:hypothetical protein